MVPVGSLAGGVVVPVAMGNALDDRQHFTMGNTHDDGK
jgi:hypothetical protein